MQSCKSCKFLVVPLNAAGRRQTRYDRGYECKAMILAQYIPDSISRSYSGAHHNSTMMLPGDGVTCPTWQKYEAP